MSAQGLAKNPLRSFYSPVCIKKFDRNCDTTFSRESLKIPIFQKIHLSKTDTTYISLSNFSNFGGKTFRCMYSTWIYR
jgi:hypothetical protein